MIRTNFYPAISVLLACACNILFHYPAQQQ
jgi:hypothetical protein